MPRLYGWLICLTALWTACNGASQVSPAESAPEWAKQFQVFVYGRPPESYLKEVAASGIAWSVFHAGVNEEELEYVRLLQSQGIHVASNFPTMQAMPSVLANDPVSSDPDFFPRIASQNLAGETAYALWIQPDPPYLPSENDPEWRDFLLRRMEEHVAGGVDGVHLDEIEGLGGHLYAFGFDPDSIAAFRVHLRKRYGSTELAADFGIEDIGGFDYAKYLRDAGARSLSDDPQPALRREFVRFHLLSRQSQLKELLAHGRTVAGRPIAFAGNAVNLGPQYQVQASLLDFLVFETMMGLPPANRLIALHRLGYRLMEGGISAMFPNIINLKEMAEGGKDWVALVMRFAEAWAARQSFLIPHNAYVYGGGTSTVSGPATVPAELIAPMTKLAWDHAGLRNADPVAPVGLMYSFESALDDFLDTGYALSFATTGHHNAFLSMGEELQKRHILFDVIYAGDDELIPRRLDRPELARHDALILPEGARFIADDEKTLDRFQKGGGRIVRSVSELNDSRWAISGDLPETVGVTVARTSEGRLAVHFVNYDYEAEAHEFKPAGPLNVEVPVAGWKLASGIAKFYSPGEDPVPLEFKFRDGVISFTLPVLEIYGLVVVG